MDEAEKLVSYIKSLPTFSLVTSIGGSYDHMGAMLTDAILQAGINYKSVVQPRADRVKRDYPEAQTTSGFVKVLERDGVDRVLNWKPGAKPMRLMGVVQLLLKHGIETENQLRHWLQKPSNLHLLKQVNGIKDKTAHYMRILVGGETVAVDTHLFKFLADAGLPTKDYETAHRIINRAANLLGVEPSILDHSIWRFMSQSNARGCVAKAG